MLMYGAVLGRIRESQHYWLLNSLCVAYYTHALVGRGMCTQSRIGCIWNSIIRHSLG